jgi:hypothetical protein
MAIREQLRNVLSIIAECTHNNVNEDIPDTWVTDSVNVPQEETKKHINDWYHIRKKLVIPAGCY